MNRPCHTYGLEKAPWALRVVVPSFPPPLKPLYGPSRLALPTLARREQGHGPLGSLAVLHQGWAGRGQGHGPAHRVRRVGAGHGEGDWWNEQRRRHGGFVGSAAGSGAGDRPRVVRIAPALAEGVPPAGRWLGRVLHPPIAAINEATSEGSSERGGCTSPHQGVVKTAPHTLRSAPPPRTGPCASALGRAPPPHVATAPRIAEVGRQRAAPCRITRPGAQPACARGSPGATYANRSLLAAVGPDLGCAAAANSRLQQPPDLDRPPRRSGGRPPARGELPAVPPVGLGQRRALGPCAAGVDGCRWQLHWRSGFATDAPPY